MYLVTEELLVEAHKGAEGPWISATFFLGFLVYLVIEELIIH
jgi:ZIP family zinc transporter